MPAVVAELRADHAVDRIPHLVDIRAADTSRDEGRGERPHGVPAFLVADVDRSARPLVRRGQERGPGWAARRQRREVRA
jgi:hypothetical protein